jgi:sulfur carrier protein
MSDGGAVRLVVNGEARALQDGMTLTALVLDVAGRLEGTAAAINGEVVPRSAWAGTLLRADDRVELLTARPGG